MKRNFVFLQKLRTNNCSLLFALCSLFFINCATAQSNTPFSKYGVIQNVQNYSSNPFWSPDAPYNQRMPTAVYAKGPDVETADCQNIVAYLVAAECANRNNCASSRLLDVRPSIVLQLSQMSGGSYVTACAGYIDAAFDQYKKQNAVAAPSAGVAFPVTTGTGVVNDGVTIEKQNPFSPKLQEWQMEILGREQELKDLQAANGVKQPQIVPVTEFPTTYADLPFSERMENAKTGYEPFKGTSAYKEIKIESEENYLKRHKLTTTPDNKKNIPESEDQTPGVISEGQTPGLITENLPDEFEALFPWYGILIVKAGSLDEYAKQDLPIISTEYMKQHRNEFYPDNSDRTMGWHRACTHSNHMAHDKDVINRATHIQMGQKDSYWSGSDFYVYDGADVYWGWATIAGEVALALLTFGISAEVTAAKTVAQITDAGVKTVKGASSAVTAVKLSKDGKKVQKAIEAAKAAKKADAASRTAAIDALSDAGITVRNTANYKSLNAIGRALESAAALKPVSWVSSLRHPWKLVASGAKNIVPKTANALGPGSTWSKRFATLAIGGGAVGANYFGRELIKAFGYSSAALKDPQTGNVSFNSFGLLSDDDEEGRENVVSHGAWIQFETIGTQNDDDAINEATRFAEELTEEINRINAEDPQCNVDVYVVQPAISNPKKLPGPKAIWYILMNNNTDAFKVRTGK